MERDGMEMAVKVGGQWVSLAAFRARRQRRDELWAALKLYLLIAWPFIVLAVVVYLF